ncbi:hypothetical protein BC828DRAFT_81130 [Blastocladiella britannica]|nr:hypothetical protein BC828DRAFT_81130 [Blastocladiella britannica]
MGGGGANCGVDMATRDGDLITQAETLAHELGHNFGSQHDSTGNACPSGQNVMSPWAGEYFNFSTCSTTYISNWYTSSGQYLPWQAPVVKCGNGILDAGEQCDPGTFNSTGSACCTSSCTLRSNAGCDPSQGGCCDPSTCAMRPMGSPCRGIPQLASSYGTCDLPDVCSGTTPVCPDVQAANGTSCVSPTSGVLGTCIAGSCYSRNDYCVSIVGAGSGYNASCDGLSCRYVVCLTANNTCQPYGYGSQNQSPCNMTGVNKGKKGVCSAGTCVASPVPQMAAASPTFAPYQLPVTATDISSTLPTSTTTTTAANGGQPTTGAFETGGSPVAIGVASGASVIGALGAAAGGLVLWRRYRVRSILAGGASAVVPLSRQSGSMNALNPASRASSAVMLTTVAK